MSMCFYFFLMQPTVKFIILSKFVHKHAANRVYFSSLPICLMQFSCRYLKLTTSVQPVADMWYWCYSKVGTSFLCKQEKGERWRNGEVQHGKIKNTYQFEIWKFGWMFYHLSTGLPNPTWRSYTNTVNLNNL